MSPSESTPDIQALTEEANRMAVYVAEGGPDDGTVYTRLAAALSALSGETETEWGVKHSQGIRWERSESMARQSLAELFASDRQQQLRARGMVRLVKRDRGPIIEVENPYESEVV